MSWLHRLRYWLVRPSRKVWVLQVPPTYWTGEELSPDLAQAAWFVSREAAELQGQDIPGAKPIAIRIVVG